jgi:predicted ATPase
VGLGKIPPEDVAVNYVYASEGEKVITRLKMNEDGVFTDTWPQGFFEERLGEALALARAPLRRKGDL